MALLSQDLLTILTPHLYFHLHEISLIKILILHFSFPVTKVTTPFCVHVSV